MSPTTGTPAHGMDASLGALLTRVTALGSDRPWITFERRVRTFGELDERANRVANALVQAGLRPGERLAVLLKNTPEFFELLFGAARAGVVLVALNWRLAAPEIAEILTDAAPGLLVLGTEQLGLVPDQARKGALVLEPSYEPWLAAAAPEPPDHAVRPDDVVLQLYSSGTTGVPKGSRLTHANLAFTPLMGREFYGMGPDTVNMLVSPLFHIGGTGYALTALGQGGHTVLMTDVDPSGMIAAIETYRVTHAFVVPAVVRMLVTAAGIEDANLSSLQRIAYGGAPMTEALLRRAMATLGCGFMAVYGMTETAGTVACLQPQEHDPHGSRAGLLRSIGRALPWLEIDIVDPESGRSTVPGAVGEIWVRAGQNMAGYWNRPDETAATLASDGWLRTGDAAYRDEEGYLYLHDRIKDMIISGGENVYPAEVESVLAGHPTIADVAVIGVPSQRWGETVKAVVVPAEAATTVEADLIAYARSHLARYKCPTSVDVVDALPRNATGKVLKKVLRERYWANAAPDTH